MTAPRPLAGILWMVVTGLLFVAMTAIVKHVGDAVPAAQSAFLRYLLGLPFVIPMIRPIISARLTRRQLGLFGLRGVVHALGVILWFFALSSIPLAEVTAMGYLTPVLVTLGAGLLLGEGFAMRRLLAIAAAFAGALLVLRPGLRAIDPGHLAMLGNAVFFAASYLLAKKLSGEVSATVVVGLLSLSVPIGLAPFALAVWVTPTAGQLGLFFLTACLATAGHYTMTFAFAAAPLSVTQPVTFLQLVWSVSLGALVFAESIDAFVILGGAVIIGAISFLTWREARARRAARAPLTAAPD